MNLGTLIGLLLGTALIGAAAFIQSSSSGLSLTTLIDVTSLLIVMDSDNVAHVVYLSRKVIWKIQTARHCVRRSAFKSPFLIPFRH